MRFVRFLAVFCQELRHVPFGSAPERLTFAFPTADVVVLGARLGKLVEALHERSLEAVMPLGARYAEALGQKPWVASVVIARLDKSNGAAG
jgi:hypothetical protein